MMRLPALALVQTLQSRHHPDSHSYVKPNQYKKNTSNVNPLTSLVLSHLPCTPTQIRLRVEYRRLVVFQSGVV